MKKLFTIFSLIALFILVLGCTAKNNPKTETYHAHVDFKMYLEGTQFDFNKEEYMSTPYKHLSENVHMHDFDPNVIHLHDANATIGDFLKSLGMIITNNCIDTGEDTYCNSAEKGISLYANGKKEPKLFNYAPKDLDKILLYYGAGEPSEEMLSSITNESCIYSLKCTPPPGFVLPQESCSANEPCTLDTNIDLNIGAN